MDVQKYWDGKHSGYAQEDWITKPTIFSTQVIKYFPKQGQLLELGCGQGQDSIYFAQKGYHVTASDISQFALDQAKNRMPSALSGKLEFLQLDLSNPLPFPPESFDVIYSHLSAHYFDSQRTHQLFHEIHTSLRPGGIFAALTNADTDPDVITAQKRLEAEYYLTDDIKRRYFSLESLAEFTRAFKPLLLDDQGSTYKDNKKGVYNLLRFVGQKS